MEETRDAEKSARVLISNYTVDDLRADILVLVITLCIMAAIIVPLRLFLSTNMYMMAMPGVFLILLIILKRIGTLQEDQEAIGEVDAQPEASTVASD